MKPGEPELTKEMKAAGLLGEIIERAEEDPEFHMMANELLKSLGWALKTRLELVKL